MNTKLSALTIAFFTISLAAGSQHKKHHQKARVAHGIRSGEVTKAEAGKIREHRKDVRQEVKEAKADGTVTAAERIEINRERRDANKAIIRAKHNRKTRH